MEKQSAVLAVQTLAELAVDTFHLAPVMAVYFRAATHTTTTAGGKGGQIDNFGENLEVILQFVVSNFSLYTLYRNTTARQEITWTWLDPGTPRGHPPCGLPRSSSRARGTASFGRRGCASWWRPLREEQTERVP